jgi:hypothetical protein
MKYLLIGAVLLGGCANMGEPLSFEQRMEYVRSMQAVNRPYVIPPLPVMQQVQQPRNYYCSPNGTGAYCTAQ